MAMEESKVTTLTPAGNASGGAIVDLDFGTPAEFARKLEVMQQKYKYLQQFFQQIMVKDEDYGILPGTQKAALYKPGAEKLCELYGYAAVVKSKEEERDFSTGYYRVMFTLQMVHRGSGTLIGEGVGECSTNESKYLYRWVAENKVPRHLDKDELLFEEKDGKYGAYVSYRVPNEDLFSQWNTVLKMAYKRAFVGLTLQCTRSSGIFTQDEAELDEYADVPEEDRKKKGASGRAASANSGRYQGQQGGGQSSAGGSAAGGAKNRAFDIAKQLCGGTMDWKWLAERTSEALGRNVHQVVKDVKDGEWATVVSYLEQYGGAAENNRSGGGGDFDPSDLEGIV